MNTPNIDAIMEARENATIAELRKQNAALLEKNTELASIVRLIPRIILEARLDAKEGKETHYDHSRHNRALSGCIVKLEGKSKVF